MNNIIFDKDDVLDRVDGDLEFLESLTFDFLTSFPAQFEELKQSVEKQDTSNANKKAHSLKGALKNLGAKKSGELAFAIEQAAKDLEVSKLPSLLSEFKSAVDEYELEFRAFLAQTK